MPDEPARLAKAAADATEKADTAAELRRHEERLIAINHINEKTYAKLEVMMAKFEMIATMIMGLGHRIDISDGRFKSAQETMEITAKVLRDKTQQDRDNANQGREPSRYALQIIACIGGVILVGLAIYAATKSGGVP